MILLQLTLIHFIHYLSKHFSIISKFVYVNMYVLVNLKSKKLIIK